MIRLFIALVLMLDVAAWPSAFADTAPQAEARVKPASRADATQIIGNARKILSP